MKRERERGDGGLYKQPESDIWWMRYYRHGRQIRKSTKTTDEAEALKELQKCVRLVRNGIQYVDQRQQEGAANVTVNRELAVLKRCFRLGEQSTPKKVLHIPHFPFLKENNVRTGFLEDHQFEKLVEGAVLWFRTLVECGASIGWRHEELISLKVKQIDLEHHTLRLEPGTTKNSEGREAPMTEATRQLLAASVEGKRPDDAVFTWDNRKPVLSIHDTWARACCNAGLGAMYCKKCDAVVANEKLPQCARPAHADSLAKSRAIAACCSTI